MLGQLLHEGVFFEYRGIRPALGTIEFRHQRRAFFHADLIDAVLVAVECQQAAVAAEAYAFQRVQHTIGVQGGKIRWGKTTGLYHLEAL